MASRKATLLDVYTRRIGNHSYTWNQAQDQDGNPLFETELPDGSPIPVGEEKSTPLYDPADIIYESTADEVSRPTEATLRSLRLAVWDDMVAERLARREAKELLNNPSSDIKDRVWDLVTWAANSTSIPIAVKQGAEQLRVDILSIRQNLLNG